MFEFFWCTEECLIFTVFVTGNVLFSHVLFEPIIKNPNQNCLNYLRATCGSLINLELELIITFDNMTGGEVGGRSYSR